MEILCLQTDIIWHDPAANLAQISAFLEEAQPPPGTLAVLPEMCTSGFSGDVAAATSGAANIEQALAALAQRHGIALMAGMAVPAAEGAANESVTWGPDGRELARYRKLQPFTPANEHLNYSAGRRVVTFHYGGFTIAPFICYDLRFPEVFRTAVRQGADLIVVIGNWPDRRHQHWTTLLKARAIENQAAVIGVNRAGTDPEFTYAGGSIILGPQAEVIAEAGKDPGFIRSAVEPGLIHTWRAAFPALRDQRSDYDSL